jgi:hypothetical protein
MTYKRLNFVLLYFHYPRLALETILRFKLCAEVTSLATTYALTTGKSPPIVLAIWLALAGDAPTTLNLGVAGGAAALPPPPPPPGT